MGGGALARQCGSEPHLRRFDSCSPSVIVLRFTASWCGPCKQYAPVLTEFAEENELPVDVIDIDERPDLVETFGIKSVPTTVLMKGGTELARIKGAKSKNDLQNELGNHL